MPRRRIFVSGLVQGVGFRFSAERAGAAEGLEGWVRNRRDGRVEALVEGPEEAVERFVAWCREGPPAARVRDVETEDEPAGEPLGSFHVERTA